VSDDDVREGVRFSHLDVPLHDEDGVTKRDLVDYLDAVADRMVPVLTDRPLSVVRVRPGQAPFMQKNVPDYAPDWIRTVVIPAHTSRREIRYALCNDRRTLLWLANQRAVEFHPPLFTMGPDAVALPPTHLVLDLDPPEGKSFAAVAAAAHLVRQVLQEAAMDGAVKTSGSKGLHIFVPLTPTAKVEDVAAATRAVAARAERLDPHLTTTAFIRDDRAGRVFLDSTRAGGATVAAAYSPRIRPGLPISFPLRWDELEAVTPGDFTVRTALERIGDTDPWRELMPAPQNLDSDLVAEGRTIPVARVQAMHEGKRRKRAASRPDGET
jgi:bifunctional non-homologous end joining protein LigD